MFARSLALTVTFIVLSPTSGVAAAAAAPAPGLRVGAAAVKITPEPGTPMAGYYHARGAESVDNDLHSKAVVIEVDGTKAALVVCDLIAMPDFVANEARRLIEKDIPTLPAERVMVSATHTHTGPLLPGRSLRDASQGGDSDLAKKYVAALPGLIAQSVREADAKLTPATAMFGMGGEERLSFNRRFLMKDGKVGWNPGKLNPNIVKPVGPTDPDVAVAYFESVDKAPLATLVNFAMHLDTVGGRRVSADYPHTLSLLLARVKAAPDMVTAFTIGTAGDINHIDVSNDVPQQGPAEAARIGTALAGEVVKTYARLKPVNPSPLRGRREIIPLPLAPITPEQLEESRKVAVSFGKDEPPFMQKVQAFKVLDVAAREGKPLDAEVQVIALGDELAFVALPGEVFVELGLAIKQASPFKHTVVVELANGSIGYIPTRRAYDEGNYEPVSARCAAGSGEQLVETALKLLKEMNAGGPPR